MKVDVVISKTYDELKKIKGAKFNQELSLLARRALLLCGKKSGVNIPSPLPQKDDGTPLQFGKFHWSISHKPDYVMASLSTLPIGVDVEEIRKRSPEVLDYVVSEEEWSLCPAKRGEWSTFYRFWTAKESVLKGEKIGIAGLSKCRIKRIISENLMEAEYRDKDSIRRWKIEQFYHDNHIFSVAMEGEFEVSWFIE
jgi:4'-phosphopantetheinyl transferase